ncbi:Ribosomal protein L35 [Phaffia rhodozyma]|uniref:Ribosomal protein L35 n=1 Tax=Phaffia rhodozyma TaxID=264483 RepID=A0A0F7SNK1_PHARH|nr:Ribosomal protein L35 [Phaffia rhodozyma]
MVLCSRSLLYLRSSSSLVLSRSAGSRQPIQRLPSLFNSISLSSSSSSPRSLLSASSTSLPSSLSRPAIRSFSSSLPKQTPRPGLLKKKKLGKYPWRNFKKVKTHSGCKARFKSYKNGTFKHIKAGQNQKNIKDNAAKRHIGSVKILCGPMQTRKLKKLMPYWKRTRRGGGW